MAFAVWLTGLPGSGKSTIARRLKAKLPRAEWLRMDEFRGFITPKREYTEEERDIAYRAMILAGKHLVRNGISVIFDATGHRRKWRELARKQIPNFYEVYVKCPLKTAMEREANRKDSLIVRNMYRKALQRLEGKRVKMLGEVIGIDVPYGAPRRPDLVIDSETVKPGEAARKILRLVR